MVYVAAKYNGKLMTKTIPQWADYLKDKPVCDHLKTQTMHYRVKQAKKGLMTMEQALGIDEYEPRSGKSKPLPLVSNKERVLFDSFNEFLRMRLV